MGWGGRHWRGDLDLRMQTRRSGARLPGFPFQERTVAWVGGGLALMGFQAEGARGRGVGAPGLRLARGRGYFVQLTLGMS